jgi:pyruvate dehydrogenase E2 component (dihydrolipoamide acetyltransferase)
VSLRGGGLVNPCIHDVDRLSRVELMEKLTDLVTRARSGRLRASELSDGTLTVTNLGQQGVTRVFPIIQPPQVAIVGFGRVQQRPWVVDDEMVVRPIIDATLAADHRVSDGHTGGLFLRAIERALAHPEPKS